MVMFTMVDLADKFHLRNPLECVSYIWDLEQDYPYLCFRFVKKVFREIEEAAMIDGFPLQTYFRKNISDFKTYGDHRCNLKCNVDME